MGTIASTGSTIVTAKTGRFRRRLAMGIIGLVLLLVGGVIGAGILLNSGGDGGGTEAVAVPEAELPDLGDAVPVLASLSAEAPAPDPTTLGSQVTPLLTAPGLGSGVSAEIVDVASGDVLLDLDAADPATPASTAKLLTAAAALVTLDPADTLETTVVAGASPGEVVLVGGGDLTLSRTAPSETYPGAPTVADLATQVVAAMPAGTPVTRVVVDSSLFSGPLTASGWGPADAPSSYAAPVTATAVDGARVSPGSVARSGQPGLDAGAALADALGAPGATVVLGQATAGAETLATVHSAPIARLVEQALSMSDNMLAEALARQVAIARNVPASFEGAAQAVTEALAEAGIDVTGVSLADGSGLSREDRVPAGVLTDVVAGAADGSLAGASALLSGLPVAGYDGTLFDRGDAETAPGTVRAKTGTLLGVHALAGTVVTLDGRLLAFAVVADASAGEEAAESALDDVAAALAGCGCR
ncbi:D-alanyl-D-alanine carboxypeptidase/D-alanyl-D-alanine-endopeptidase [Blastococcus sp. CT_GayMR20]|uniref:D-alanyl-D-alanine carboxypeptidase/D-alanyl-D-alanine endopeptidase n=1 Tax=Blastococcus sp. CT_GayMR20 TaxID=2559609 RepID=UPI00107343B8|nr:D-alanyl-D-alanine carboxypeptidase/D-alanyl-D-alanine-endopeptidase [Blastococcus sp. CT_GayMR20]TFV71273.1 D-alanyl-D-alanine carboxypeptidase/D-alanyl-D-alanine-endopeptidase [Blastococcus sp. CT_GayMR20]